MNGTLLIAGGNVGATEQGAKDIFGAFVRRLNGKKAMLIVCASGVCEESYAVNAQLLRENGAAEVVLLPLTEDEALVRTGKWTNRADERLLPLFEGVGGVWFTGGDQLRTVRLLLDEAGADTPVLKRIRALLASGGVVGGTSAGAAIMSRRMIVRGDDPGALNLPVCTDLAQYPDLDAETSPEQLLVLQGLGFLPEGLVDQHFNRRARLQRLLAAMEASGETEGFGVSEDTALEIDLQAGTLRVRGSAYVLHITRQNGCVTLNKQTAADAAVQDKPKK